MILGTIGPFFYTSIENSHWLSLLAICMLGASGHFLMINAFKHSEASLCLKALIIRKCPLAPNIQIANKDNQ